MKKKFLCSTLAMAMTASMLFGCASESKTETTAAAGETTAAAAETTAEAAKAETNGEKLKVTLLVTGSFGDKAFNDSAQAGMEKLEAELGDKVEVNMVEMGSDKTKFEGSMLDACESDADLIITGLWDMKEITEKVAQEFPEKKFIIFDTDVDYTLGDLSNVYSMSYKQNEGAFLAGVLAASATKSDMEYANEENVIGFVGAKDTAAVINDSAVGFIEGAQFVDPDVKVLVSYVGSYVDSATAKELAITQYSNGADVVFVAAGPASVDIFSRETQPGKYRIRVDSDQASVGVIEAAAESKKYCIGVDSDQALAYEGKDEANFIISSAIKGVGDSIYNAVEKAVDGTLPYGEYQILGIEDDVVGLADNDIYQSAVSEDAKKAVEDAKEKLLAGEVTVDSAYGMDEATLKGIINGAQ